MKPLSKILISVLLFFSVISYVTSGVARESKILEDTAATFVPGKISANARVYILNANSAGFEVVVRCADPGTTNMRTHTCPLIPNAYANIALKNIMKYCKTISITNPDGSVNLCFNRQVIPIADIADKTINLQTNWQIAHGKFTCFVSPGKPTDPSPYYPLTRSSCSSDVIKKSEVLVHGIMRAVTHATALTTYVTAYNHAPIQVNAPKIITQPEGTGMMYAIPISGSAPGVTGDAVAHQRIQVALSETLPLIIQYNYNTNDYCQFSLISTNNKPNITMKLTHGNVICDVQNGAIMVDHKDPHKRK